MAAPAAGDGNIAALAGLESGPISTRSAARRGKPGRRGEVAEWLKAHAWNACIRETVSRVRIPLSPPVSTASGRMRLFERTNCVTTGSDQVARRYEFAIDLGRRAGDLGMTFFRSAETLKVESKGHQDLVSNGDREVELFVRAAISEAFPQDGIVGEEHAPKEGRSGFDWVIDPIDGTANFVRGIPAWCVAIACVHDKRTVVGVIHEPSANECFSARRGGGAFLNGRPITVSKSTSLADGSVGTGFSNRREARRIVPVIEALLAEGGVFFR